MMFDRVLNSSLQSLIISAKRFVLHIWQGSEYASAIYTTIDIRILPIKNVAYLFTKFA